MHSSPSGAPGDARADHPPSDTKERLLDAAERLFAERGYEGTSVRAVTRDARASVSAANYHFGSKAALLRAALVRRLEPLNRRRLEALDGLEAAAAGGAVRLEGLLEAFLRPGFEAGRESTDGRAPFRHIAAQLFADSHEQIAALKAELFGPVIARFIDALGRALPERSREDLVLDFRFVLGVMVHVIGGHAPGEVGPSDPAEPSDEEILRRMVSFAAAGLRAEALESRGATPPGDGR